MFPRAGMFQPNRTRILEEEERNKYGDLGLAATPQDEKTVAVQTHALLKERNHLTGVSIPHHPQSLLPPHSRHRTLMNGSPMFINIWSIIFLSLINNNNLFSPFYTHCPHHQPWIILRTQLHHKVSIHSHHSLFTLQSHFFSTIAGVSPTRKISPKSVRTAPSGSAVPGFISFSISFYCSFLITSFSVMLYPSL